MKNRLGYISTVISAAGLFFTVFSCNNNESANKGVVSQVKTVTIPKTSPKPHSTYPDTLMINHPAAVFYRPDSIQLAKIKAVSDPMYYEASLHEYFYQMLTARNIFKKTWPWLTIIESDKYRVLMFIRKNNSREYIDLDTMYDTHGLFVFDGKKSPILIDMTNVETQVSFYLKE